MPEDRMLAAEDSPLEDQPELAAPGAIVEPGQEMPRVRFSRGQIVAFGVFVISILAFLYFVLPKLLGLKETWNRLEQGNAWWLALAAVLTALSFWAYVWLFRAVFVRGESRIGWRGALPITRAG